MEVKSCPIFYLLLIKIYLDLEEINGLLVRNPHCYNLRKSFNSSVSRTRTEVGHKTSTHRAALAWNSSLDESGQHENPQTLKAKLKSLIKNINFTKECSVINRHFRYY